MLCQLYNNAQILWWLGSHHSDEDIHQSILKQTSWKQWPDINLQEGHPLICRLLFWSLEFGITATILFFGARRDHIWVREWCWGGYADWILWRTKGERGYNLSLPHVFCRSLLNNKGIMKYLGKSNWKPQCKQEQTSFLRSMWSSHAVNFTQHICCLLSSALFPAFTFVNVWVCTRVFGCLSHLRHWFFLTDTKYGCSIGQGSPF